MKKQFLFIFICLFSFSAFLCLKPAPQNLAKAISDKPKMCIVIDDFGSYEQTGVETLLSIDDPITCAVLPNVDNTNNNIEAILKTNHELILHMPMQAHVNLPESWYGPVYIKNTDNPDSVQKKLDEIGIENEIINFMPHDYDNHGEIISAHPEEKVSSAKKIENYTKFRKEHLRLTKDYIGISNVDELDYDAYILASDTVWTPLRVHDIESYMMRILLLL